MKKKLLFLFGWLLLSSVCIAKNELKEGIRGVWVPAPRFTSVMHSYKNIIDFVASLEKLNMNSIYLVSYAGDQTIYSSKVLTKYSTYKSSQESNMLTPYIKDYNIPLKSPTGDPLRDLLNEAHKRNIKVFFWFEYGFMGEGKPISKDSPVLAKNPHWIGLGNDGQPSNYNKSDYYFNAYNPAVQNFLIDLIQEALRLYPDLDGIQGDDRMPAMPRNSGYDAYTISLYQSEHNGAIPPNDFNEPSWIRWRLDILNNFGKKLYRSVKELNPKAMVSFAPNPFPWSMDNLMQEWPQWCKDGICDLLAVQCYRYNADAYRATVTQVLKYIRENNPSQIFAPGIILMEGKAVKMTPELLAEELAINRELGINGEIYFYNEALNDKKINKLLKKLYRDKVSFPK